MELNEEIELVNNDHDGQQLLMEQLEENIEKLIKNLTIAFDELNGCEARKLTIKYSYYNNALAKLKSSILKNSGKWYSCILDPFLFLYAVMKYFIFFHSIKIK